MIKFPVLALLVVLVSPKAFAMDHRSQFGVGGGLGGTFAAPWNDSFFKDNVGAKLPAVSAWARYIPGTPEIGVELSYNYIALSKMNFHAHTVIAEFISRQNPWGNFHPFYGFGAGYARTANKFATGDAGVFDDPIIKATAGIEFEMNEQMDVGLRIDHYSIFRDNNTQRSMHMISPMLSINYYLGKPAPLPPANPAPAPVAAPVPPPPPAPAVAAPNMPAIKDAPKAAKSAHKKAPAKKKPAKKKKKKVTPPEATEGAQ